MITRLRVCLARRDGGAVAIVTAILMLVFLSLTAFAVDVGNWYAVGLQEQRAADAAALAGVINMPGDQTGAFKVAKSFASQNGFTHGAGSATVVPGVGSQPSRLKVTVSKTVTNVFGGLMGRPTTTVTKSAVADYAAPVPMGSPCNEFGQDPDATPAVRGTTCAAVTGKFWANVNSPNSAKSNGDSYQSLLCGSAVDGCSASNAGPNTDYRTDGYFYTISVKQSMPSLTVELFDPVFVDVGLKCDSANFGGGGTAATKAKNSVVTDGATRYAGGAASAYCTGDGLYGGSQTMETKFTLRSPGVNQWDPLSFLAVCTKSYKGYSGTLFDALNQTSTLTYRPDIADGFRRWTTLCTVNNPPVGDYLLQVQSNVGGPPDSANAGNRFAVRATATNINALSISGRENMGIFSNLPGGVTEFYLARVPSGAAGQVLNVRLFDVGDSDASGTITVVPPGGGYYSGCTGTGVITMPLPNCQFGVPAAPSPFNGKWQQVSVPIPATYTCNDSDNTACWVKLQYSYGAGSSPTDVTTWTASIEGDPVRLVQ